MDAEATQPATQPYKDPRRDGLNNSGLIEQDVADIICILHPSSMPAHTAVTTTARLRPQHILQRQQVICEPDGNESSVSSSDIALRFSSKVHDLAQGFCFGRNATRSDILLSADDGEKRISNMHFRIYLNVEGILMLEDTSTNGTMVDGKVIRKDRKHGAPTTQMLQPGSVINLVAGGTTAGIKFIVRLPSRDEFESQYRLNFVRYLNRIRQVTQAVEAVRQDAPFVSHHQMSHSHGMQWNGGTKYNVTGLLGKGAFATVYKLATKDDGEVYACKELDKRRLMKNNVLDHKVDSEMRIMQGLDHPNIVKFHDYFDHNNRWIYIIMEYVGGGELSNYLSQVGQLQEDKVKTIARQVLHALQYLHRRRITHRDIKPDNILISSFNPFRVKLSDFGLSKVVQEETMLKTFCGTLLYCAPEVYPEYENFRRGEARKRRHVGDPVPKTSPYDQSVDMWSFGTVLFHILCGQPPYKGSADDRGAQMLRNIMTNDADYSMLTNAGVSEEGVDFVRKLLNRNPSARPKEAECFQHPWLMDVPDEFNYMEVDGAGLGVETDLVAVEEADEEDLGASAVEINDDEDFAYDAEDGQEGQNDPQQGPSSPEPVSVKRQRILEEPDSCHQVVMVQEPSGDIRYPSLPNMESYNSNNPSVGQDFNAPSGGSRLFGEIPQTALQSSGALGGQWAEGSSVNLPEFQLRQQSEISSYSDLSSSMEFPSDFALSPDAANQTHNNLLSVGTSKFAMTDPSLMGAESLVNQLNVESVNSPRAPSTDPNSDNPATPGEEAEAGQMGHVRQTYVSASGDQKGSGYSEEDTPHAEEFSRRIELGPHPSLPSQASNGNAGNGPSSNNNINKSSQRQGQARNAGSENAVPDELARTIDERTGEEVESFHTPIAEPRGHRGARGTAEGSNGEEADTFAKPPPLLGKLTPLPGSISDQPIRLESRLTSWGRGTNATVRHHDPMDTRIPAYALELTFWAPSIESHINAGQDWTQMSEVTTIISTKTRGRIWVNDVELRSESSSGDAYLFGKIYTGDIITVYRDREQFLRFKCEFYHGRSMKSRAEVGETKFVVEKTAKTRSESERTSSKTMNSNNNTTTMPPAMATSMATTLGKNGSDTENKSPVEAQRRAHSVT